MTDIADGRGFTKGENITAFAPRSKTMFKETNTGLKNVLVTFDKALILKRKKAKKKFLSIKIFLILHILKPVSLQKSL